MNKSLQEFFVYKLPPFVYAAAIITLSSIPNAQPPSFDILNIDKFYHFCEYFLFGLLVFRAFPNVIQSPRKRVYYVLLFALGLLFAAGDETVQSFVPNRDSSVGDWIADVCGYMAAGVTVVIYRGRVSRKKS